MTFEGTPADSTPADSTPPSARPAFGKWPDAPLFWLALFVALNLVVPFFDIPSRATAIVGAIALTIAYVTIVVCFAVSLARLKLPLIQLLIYGVLAALAWLALDNWITPEVMKPIIAAVQKTGTRPDAFQTGQVVALMTATDGALLCLAVFAGNLAARMISSPNMVGPVCAVIALIDIWGVLFGGIVSQMLEKTPQLAAKAMTKGPQIGAVSGSQWAIPLPSIGVGDYLFLGLLFGVLLWHGLNWRAAMNWVIPLVCAALLAITLFPRYVPHLPGLLFIALGVAIPNREVFHYTREEKFALLYAAIFVAILSVALYFGVTSVLPEKK